MWLSGSACGLCGLRACMVELSILINCFFNVRPLLVMGVLVAEHIGNNCASTAEAISASAVGVSHTSRRKVELLERNAGDGKY